MKLLIKVLGGIANRSDAHEFDVKNCFHPLELYSDALGRQRKRLAYATHLVWRSVELLQELLSFHIRTSRE
jgi:hypothetical protein